MTADGDAESTGSSQFLILASVAVRSAVNSYREPQQIPRDRMVYEMFALTAVVIVTASFARLPSSQPVYARSLCGGCFDLLLMFLEGCSVVG
jgi:hypothetical protein